MRAARFDRYGAADVLALRDVADPQPGAGQVLVRMTAASVNPKDVFVRKGRFRQLTGGTFPLPSGYDGAGIVEQSDVARLPPGVPVFGMLNGWRGGTVADLVAWPAEELSEAPRTIPLADAAVLPLAGLTALQALRDHLAVRPGQTILINGASGGVGSFAVQIARALGADVTAVCSRTRADHVAALGATSVHDYAAGRLPDATFDGVFDVFGNLSARSVAPILSKRGRYVTTVPSRSNLVATLAVWRRPRTRIVNVRSTSRDLVALARLVDDGKLRVVIDARYPAIAIADAHRHVERKHTLGKVVVDLQAAAA